jgi:hypothetical protein
VDIVSLLFVCRCTVSSYARCSQKTRELRATKLSETLAEVIPFVGLMMIDSRVNSCVRVRREMN